MQAMRKTIARIAAAAAGMTLVSMPQRGRQAIPAPGTWAARLSVAWCVLFASTHLYWAMGGTAGFRAVTGSLELARQTWFVVFGLSGVALVGLAGAPVALATVSPWGQWVSAWMLHRAVGGRGRAADQSAAHRRAGHAARHGVLRPGRALDWPVVRWWLALWTPWFIVGSALFFATTVGFEHHKARRTWGRP